jgi:comEA protein
MRSKTLVLALCICLSVVVFNGLQSVAFAKAAETTISEEMAVININTATAEELQEIKGIGPKLAARIVEYRSQYGDFDTPEALMNVRGVGEAKYAKIKQTITV